MASDHTESYQGTLVLSKMPTRIVSKNSDDRKEHLYTNHFTCSLANSIPIYLYDAAIEEMNTKSNNWREIDGRARCAVIMQSIISNHQLQPNVFVWYDEQKYLCSTSNLLTPQFKFNENGQNRLHVKSLINQWSTIDINDYIRGQTEIYPYDTVHILETLLKRSLQDRIKTVKNKNYFVDETVKELGNGFEQRNGFIQTLNLSSHRLTLNIQTRMSTFYSDMSLIDFIHKQIGRNDIPSVDECQQLNQILQKCLIVTQESNRRIEYEFDAFVYKRPAEIYIRPGESLTDYFQHAKNITLIQPDYPCIQVYVARSAYDRMHFLPLEICEIKQWQIYEPFSQIQEGGNYVPTPEERYLRITNTIKSCNYNSSLLCQALGFYITNIDEMLEFDARILTPPRIKSGLHYPAHVDNGVIFLGGHIFTPKPISNLAITYFGRNFKGNESVVDVFVHTLIDVMERYNIYGHHEEHNIAPIFEDIDEHFQSMVEQRCQFMICLMDESHEDDLTQLRINIKKCGSIRHGIMTQCVRYSEIPISENNLNSYCEGLIRKINFKNGGINTKVDLDMALEKKQSEKDLYMFFGANILHGMNDSHEYPSIAAIIGSVDSSCARSAGRVCKQYPGNGKFPIDTIAGIGKMVEELLDYNRQENGYLPNKIVFYRDGIENKRVSKILECEIPAIRQAFDKMYGDKTKHPLLTVVAVKRRHNTCFFTYNSDPNQETSKSEDSSRVTDNMSIGCVIDTTIVHPYQHDFYLNSHSTYRGVNRPPLYHVLLDEIGFTADELQLLTYHLCFTDARSSASEAIPSVAHQASIAALNARDLFCNDDVTEQDYHMKDTTINDLAYEMLNVHENLKNLPVFS
ncbi:unnamed protein product [Adineta steineri]|uniref:Piwi domain-containing protein n=1 Tax=Adineta steineri TaxID=433720 RepID=A0A814SQ48_9BILA|nr:unnamed protein product [Adineta steineri]CAF1483135.1 unnamed protein product [Adineta steineri]